MGYVAGSTSLKAFPNIPLSFQQIHDPAGAGTYKEFYKQNIDFDNIDTIFFLYYYDDLGGANCFTRFTIGGVVKFTNEDNGSGYAGEEVDCTAISGTQEMLIEYKCGGQGRIRIVCVTAS